MNLQRDLSASMEPSDEQFKLVSLIHILSLGRMLQYFGHHFWYRSLIELIQDVIER